MMAFGTPDVKYVPVALGLSDLENIGDIICLEKCVDSAMKLYLSNLLPGDQAVESLRKDNLARAFTYATISLNLETLIKHAYQNISLPYNGDIEKKMATLKLIRLIYLNSSPNCQHFTSKDQHLDVCCQEHRQEGLSLAFKTLISIMDNADIVPSDALILASIEIFKQSLSIEGHLEENWNKQLSQYALPIHLRLALSRERDKVFQAEGKELMFQIDRRSFETNVRNYLRAVYNAFEIPVLNKLCIPILNRTSELPSTPTLFDPLSDGGNIGDEKEMPPSGGSTLPLTLEISNENESELESQTESDESKPKAVSVFGAVENGEKLESESEPVTDQSSGHRERKDQIHDDSLNFNYELPNDTMDVQEGPVSISSHHVEKLDSSQITEEIEELPAEDSQVYISIPCDTIQTISQEDLLENIPPECFKTIMSDHEALVDIMDQQHPFVIQFLNRRVQLSQVKSSQSQSAKNDERIDKESDSEHRMKRSKTSSYKKRRPFSREEEKNLRAGVERFGHNWIEILRHFHFNDRTNVDIKDKARNLGI